MKAGRGSGSRSREVMSWRQGRLVNKGRGGRMSNTRGGRYRGRDRYRDNRCVRAGSGARCSAPPSRNH